MPDTLCVSQFNIKAINLIDGGETGMCKVCRWKQWLSHHPTLLFLPAVPMPWVADPFRYKNRSEFHCHQAGTNYRLPLRKTFLSGTLDTFGFIYEGWRERGNSENGRVWEWNVAPCNRVLSCFLSHVICMCFLLAMVIKTRLCPLSIVLLRFFFN